MMVRIPNETLYIVPRYFNEYWGGTHFEVPCSNVTGVPCSNVTYFMTTRTMKLEKAAEKDKSLGNFYQLVGRYIAWSKTS